MTKKKGFTLVELLAVIVILAVLVLLAVPSVIKMMDNSKKKSFEVEAENIIKGAKLAYADSLLSAGTIASTNVTASVGDPAVSVTGKCFDIKDLGNYVDKTFATDDIGSVLVDAASNKYYIWYYDGVYSITGGLAGAVEVDPTTAETRTDWDSCSTGITNLRLKIINDNTIYADNVTSPYVTSASGIDFTAKSTLTNGQGLYTNNKLEDGSNTYFRGGSFCAYTNYEIEDTSGTYCTAAGGTWHSYNCSLNTDRVACSSQGFTYYDLKNNVTFAGHNWKIIRIDENNNIRMILADNSVSVTAFNSTVDDNAHVGFMYGTVPSTSYEIAHANTNNSTIKTALDNWYSANLTSYASYLSDPGYCNDRSLTSGVGYGKDNTVYKPYTRNHPDTTASPRLNISSSCANASNDLFTTSSSTIGNKALTYPVGLVTVDEARYAGMVFYGATADTYSFTNYLRFRVSYWTMSPSQYNPPPSVAYGYYVSTFGYFHSDSVGSTHGLRASVSLKSSTSVLSGSGTYDSPYVIE